MVLSLNYLLTASLGTMATVAWTRESLRTKLGHSQPLVGEKGRCPPVGMGMRCCPSSVGARTISSLNNLHSKLRATIQEKKAK